MWVEGTCFKPNPKVSEQPLTFYSREVHKARNRATNELVAMKSLLLENEKEGVSGVVFLLWIITIDICWVMP